MKAILKHQSLSHSAGSEGPRNDPYHYEEWTLTRQLQYGAVWKYVLHVGLAITLVVVKDGTIVQTWTGDEKIVFSWQNLTHLRFKDVEDIYHRLNGPYRKCPHCHSRDISCTGGFAGEQIQFCNQCDTVLYEEDPTSYIR